MTKRENTEPPREDPPSPKRVRHPEPVQATPPPEGPREDPPAEAPPKERKGNATSQERERERKGNAKAKARGKAKALRKDKLDEKSEKAEDKKEPGQSLAEDDEGKCCHLWL